MYVFVQEKGSCSASFFFGISLRSDTFACLFACVRVFVGRLAVVASIIVD